MTYNKFDLMWINFSFEEVVGTREVEKKQTDG